MGPLAEIRALPLGDDNSLTDDARIRFVHASPDAPAVDIALANGGSDEGVPGPRGEPDDNGLVFYAAYFRDPDGNKLNAFLMDKVA